jgi:hypothetical protein
LGNRCYDIFCFFIDPIANDKQLKIGDGLVQYAANRVGEEQSSIMGGGYDDGEKHLRFWMVQIQRF